MNTLLYRRSNKLSLKSIILLAIMLFVSANILEKTIWASRPDGSVNTFAYLLKGLRYIAYFLSLLSIFLKCRYSKKSLIYFSLVLLILLLSMFGSRDRMLFLCLLLFIAAEGTDSDGLIRCVLVVQILIGTVTILSSFLGFSEDIVFTSNDSWTSGTRDRHYLGFRYTTYAPILYLYIVLEYLFLKRGKLPVWKYFLLMLPAVYFFDMTRTRYSFIVTMLALTFFLFCTKFMEKGTLVKGFRLLVLALPFLAFAVSLYAAVFYNGSNEIWSTVNELMTGRLRLSHEGFVNYGITLFGQPIEWVGNNIYSLLYGFKDAYNYVDSSFLKILYEYGIITVLLILTAYTALLRKAIQNKAYYLVWITVFVLIHTIAEPYLVNFAFNPFLFVLVGQLKETEEHREVRERQKIRLRCCRYCREKLYLWR